MRELRQRLQQLNKKLWLLVAAGLVAIIVGGMIYQTRNSPPIEKDPVKGTAIEVYILQQSIQKLKSIFDDNNSRRTTHNYLDSLGEIEKACRRVDNYSKAQNIDQISDTDSGRIKQTVALCKDLSELAAKSKYIYLAIEPLLSTSSTSRRYQTLPPFAGQVRSNHVSATSDAINKLSEHKPDKTDFPFSALSELKQLQIAIDNSKKLEYLPALDTFQVRLLAERQQYWKAYADIESLIHSLEVQLAGYCQNLKKDDAPLKQCSSSLNPK